MHPILFEIGPFTLYSYGLLLACGFLLSAGLIIRDSRNFDVSTDRIFDCLLALLIAGLIGGRLLFVLINHEYYFRYPFKALMLREGGMAIHGAIGAAIIAGIIVCRVRKLSFWNLSDLFAPYIALGQSIGRIGCFLNGCCYGKPVSSGPGVTFPGDTVSRIPTQIYSSLGLLLIYILLIEMRKNRPFNGYVFCKYLILYGLFRFFMDFYRDDNPAVLGLLTLSQIISVAILVSGVVIYWVRVSRVNKARS